MSIIESIRARAEETKRGFSDLQKIAAEVVALYSEAEAFQIAEKLYKSKNNSYQARMVSVLIWGTIGTNDNMGLFLLRRIVSRDRAWQVQEMLAQAFDHYCKRIGYEAALPLIRSWLQDEHSNVRRAVSEGLRIWTARPYFREHPTEAIALLSPLRTDESEYVRKSVGNALRDITRKHAELVWAEIATWNREDERVAQVYGLVTKNQKSE